MSITIFTKNIGEVKERKYTGNFKWEIEDGIEQWIKKNLRCENE